MNTLLRKFAYSASLLIVFVLITVPQLQAEEVDFSCMSHTVRSKTRVSEHNKEYDIVLKNHCPGPVYWSMCIERMDPWTNEIQESLTPSGLLQAQKKSRVNLQMKKRPDQSQSRWAFQEFYLSVGYTLNPPVAARCVASACESKLRGMRMKFRANDTAWQQAKKAVAARVSTECPQSGWDNSTQEDCEAKIRASSQASMDQFAQNKNELKEKMAAVDPEQCQVHAGD